MDTTDKLREDVKDLGFGSRVAEQSRDRLLNRDGTFNVSRKGLSFFRSLSLYHHLLTMSWIQFQVIIAVSYVLFNVVFAVGYILCGEQALLGSTAVAPVDRFLDAFFFSVQTSTTIGYGHIVPTGIAANVLVSIEAMTGLLGFALATSLLFARFSRPSAQIIFSHQAVIAPYQGISALEFRIANERRSQLIQVEARVLLARWEGTVQKKTRMFYELTLARSQVLFFPLHWTIVHPIDQQSPLVGMTVEQFLAGDFEFLVLLTGIDETFSQTVHARTSYKAHEVVWGARFSDMFQQSNNGIVSVDLRRIHMIEPVNQP